MSGPLFSVVIPTHGRPELLADTVRSVLAQTIDDLECLVVDDGGGEDFDLPDDVRVRIIRRPENGGTAATRNTGIDEAVGTYVTFIDDDDLFTADRLELALEGLERAPVSVCWIRHLDGESEGGRMLDGDVGDVILDDLVPHVGACAIPRDRILRFDESMRSGEDVEWWLRTAQALPFATVPRVGYLYRRHPGVRYLKGPAIRARSHVEILDRYADYFATHPAAAAFRWKRVGLLATTAGDTRLARQAVLRSMRLRPSLRTTVHLGRTVLRKR